MARPPSADSILRNERKQRRSSESITKDIAGNLILPNQSGDHSAGHTNTPVNDTDIANKKYVDDENTPQDTAIALNTTHRNDNTQAHSDYLLNTGDTASGTYNFDSNTLVINHSTNRVGIGTTSPDRQLEVEDSSGTDTYTKVTSNGADQTGIQLYDGTNSAYLYLQPAGLLSLHDGTGAVLNLKSGKVGIGTSTPTTKLNIADGGTNTQTVFSINTYNDQVAYTPEMRFLKSHSDTIGTMTSTVSGEVLGQMRFRGVDSGNAYDDGAIIKAKQDGAAGAKLPTNLILSTFSSTAENTNQLVLHNDGKVGVGTVTPGKTLEVNGSLKATDYYSGDGTQGLTVNTASDAVLQFKDGLLVGHT